MDLERFVLQECAFYGRKRASGVREVPGVGAACFLKYGKMGVCLPPKPTLELGRLSPAKLEIFLTNHFPAGDS